MSVLRKKPYIEEAIEAMSENDIATLRAQLNSNTSTLRFSILDLPTVKTISAGTMDFCDGKPEKTGFLVLIPDTIAMFIAYHRFQDLAIFEIDTTNKSFKRINEYCDINELRRVIDDTVEATGDTWVDEMRSVMEKDQDNNVQISDGLYVAGDLQVNGSISGDEIVENMSGYQISTSGIDTDFTYKYVGVCKNGNKITFVWAFILNTTKTAYSAALLPPIKVPADVGDKIYPIGSFPGISSLTVALQDVALHQYADASTPGHVLFYKYDNWINPQLYANLLANVSYLGRIELTFLLSDNLIS